MKLIVMFLDAVKMQKRKSFVGEFTVDGSTRQQSMEGARLEWFISKNQTMKRV
jgi:hypothetical protein